MPIHYASTTLTQMMVILFDFQNRNWTLFDNDFDLFFSRISLVLRMIYYNDQTIAIVELGPEKLLISCELIEI